jgi:hypothetical protein
MRLYTKQHKFYCGNDLQARSMYICIMDSEGNILVHKYLEVRPEAFMKTISPYREAPGVVVDCMFTW